MIVVGSSYNKSQEKKAKGSRKFSALQEALEVLGKSQSLSEKNILCWGQLPGLSSSGAPAFSTKITWCSELVPSSGRLRMPLALRKSPVNQNWREGMEKLRPGYYSKSSRNWMHLWEHMAMETWNVCRVSHQVHSALELLLAHRLPWWLWESKLQCVAYVPTRRLFLD